MCNDTTFQLVVLVWFTCTSTSSFAIVLPAVPAGRICFGPACIVLGCDEATEYVLVVNGCYKKWIIKDFNSLYLRPFLILYKRALLLQRDRNVLTPEISETGQQQDSVEHSKHHLRYKLGSIFWNLYRCCVKCEINSF